MSSFVGTENIRKSGRGEGAFQKLELGSNFAIVKICASDLDRDLSSYFGPAYTFILEHENHFMYFCSRATGYR